MASTALGPSASPLINGQLSKAEDAQREELQRREALQREQEMKVKKLGIVRKILN